jgi:hypothetical protein
MRNDQDRRLRGYVLGASEDEREAIERAYFERADALDAVSAVEDDLIEDYLSSRLERDERERFERHYLSTPNHRRRVAVVRALRNAAAAAPHVKSRWRATSGWAIAGIAAALVILVSGAMWMSRAPAIPSPAAPAASVDRREPAGSEPRAGVPAPPARPPAVVAVSISPVLVRGADEPATVRVATGVDVVRLELEGQPGEGRLGRGRAVVRTVAGREVWRGAATEATGPRHPLARVDVPAELLPPDDYVVELLGAGVNGLEVERSRYFLRVRAP